MSVLVMCQLYYTATICLRKTLPRTVVVHTMVHTCISFLPGHAYVCAYWLNVLFLSNNLRIW